MSSKLLDSGAAYVTPRPRILHGPIILMLVGRSNTVLQATIGLIHERCPTTPDGKCFKVPHHDYSTIQRGYLRGPLSQ